MGALSNAAALMKDAEFKDLIRAAVVYVASNVLIESDQIPAHGQRASLAKQTLLDQNFVLGQVVSIVAGTPAIATTGNTAAEVSEAAIIDRVEEIWTVLSTNIFPQ